MISESCSSAAAAGRAAQVPSAFSTFLTAEAILNPVPKLNKSLSG